MSNLFSLIKNKDTTLKTVQDLLKEECADGHNLKNFLLEKK